MQDSSRAPTKPKKMDARYTVVLEPAQEGGFVVSVPALPEAHTQGETAEEALENAREVIELCLASRRQHGEDIPPADAESAQVTTVAVSLPAA